MSSSQPHKRVTLGDIEYSISEEDKTASVTKYKGEATKIIIPRSIKHESKEYIVTIIASEAFRFSRVESVSFEPNSELRTIEKEAFSYSALARIQIPSHVTQICEGAFSFCYQLSRFEFEPNSELRTIGKYAFSHSALARIQIPSHVTQICEHAFYYCNQLSRFEFEPNSELRTIGEYAFSHSALARIQIPASAVELEDGWCCGTEHLIEVEVDRGNARYSSVGGKIVIGKSDIANEYYDTLVFCARDSIEANIPATIKIIGAYAFMDSKVARIQIPSHVTQICEGAFYCCRQLSRFEFEPNSELRTIGKEAFFGSALARIQIPANVVELEDGWCFNTGNMIEVEVDRGNARYSSVGGKLVIGKSDIANEDYDTLVFCARDSTEANIPATIKIIGEYAFSESALARIQISSNVTQICEGAFCGCKQLSRFEFEPNSELRTIGKHAFLCSALASIQIPSHVTQICEGAFSWCEQLSRFEFEPNSELLTIEKDSFSCSALASILIPSHVTTIHGGAFSICNQLQIVEIDEKSLDNSIDVGTFSSSKIVMLPAREKFYN